MATTSVQYTGDGLTVLYSFPFPYIEETDVKAAIDGVVTTAFTIENTNTVRFDSAPAVGVNVAIFRRTDTEDLPYVFYPGSAIKAKDLNQDFSQILYVAQELRESTIDNETGGEINGDIIFNGNVTINKYPENDTDAANKLYVDTQDQKIYEWATDTFVDITGDTMKGQLNTIPPVAPTNAVNKAYVDSIFVSAGGDTSALPTTRYLLIAQGGETRFDPPAAFSPGNELMFVNGAQQARFYDYTTNGVDSITFNQPLLKGDVVEMVCYNNIKVIETSANFDTFPTTYWVKTATAGQTTFTGNADGTVIPLGYTPGKEVVYLNGAALIRETDYNVVGDGDTINLVQPALAGDVLLVQCDNYAPTGTPELGGLDYTYPGGVTRPLQSRLEDRVSVKDFGAVGDGVTDDTAAFQLAVNSVDSVYIPEGTYIINSGGVTLNSNNKLFGVGAGSILQSTPIVNTSSGGDHKVGNGNILNADGVDNLTVQNLVVKGVYSTSWGKQNPYTFNLGSNEGRKLVAFDNISRVTFDSVTVSNSFSSFLLGETGLQGFNAIGVADSTDVTFTNCNWTDSAGEAWLVYRCNNVVVQGCSFVNNYFVSALDIVYSYDVRVSGCQFIRKLESDTGDLLNLHSQRVLIEGCYFLNGNADIGNEYFNRATADLSFEVKSISFTGNKIYNGLVQISTVDKAGFTGEYFIEDVSITNNFITVDLDTRPSIDGFFNVNITAVLLPLDQKSNFITVANNTFVVKGNLQTSSGNPSNLNNLKIIKGDAHSATEINNLTISNNSIYVDIPNFAYNLISKPSGAIVLANAVFNSLVIDSNTINNSLGLSLDEASINNLRITNNNFRGGSFINQPYSGAQINLSNTSIDNNTFVYQAINDVVPGNADLEAFGAGAFVSLIPTSNQNFFNLFITNNTISAPIAVFMSSFNSTVANYIDLTFSSNDVTFLGDAPGLVSSYPAFKLGRNNTDNQNSDFKLSNNSFKNSSSVPVSFHFEPVKFVALNSNTFDGDYAFNLRADGSTVLSQSPNGFIVTNNISVNGTITSTFLNLANTTNRLIKNNSDQFDNFGDSITSTIEGAY